MTTRSATLGELEVSGWRNRSVKEELRESVIRRLRAGEALFPGIVGFENTVEPALERALLAGHDLVLLGERGQAKTRIIRALVDLLDEEIPIIAGCEINDSPFDPICAHCRAVVAEDGPGTPITWIGRDAWYAEKLATPDTSVADLIGDVDPIRVAEGRYLSDEHVIHYGLVPRTNRGIFSINELPDLPARIQVALFNVLEERDVQIRGFQVRLPVDVLLVATANPEDYTNRGRIITPLKDRFGSEVRTHYPLDPGHEIDIMDQEARPPSGDLPVHVPDFMKEVIAEFSRLLRRSPHVNQRAGVSVRLSIANLETLVASAVRRAIRNNEPEAVPRISDLPAVIQSSSGRVEFETFEEDRKDEILEQLLGHAVLEVFVDTFEGYDFAPIMEVFEQPDFTVESGDLVPAASLVGAFGESPAIGGLERRVGGEGSGIGGSAAAVGVRARGPASLPKVEQGRFRCHQSLSGEGSALVVSRFHYSRWDGTQDPLHDLEMLDGVADAFADRMLSGLSADRAMRRLIEDGLPGRFSGLEQLRERMREAMERRRQQSQLGGALEELRDQLDDIVATERAESRVRLGRRRPIPGDVARCAAARRRRSDP